MVLSSYSSLWIQSWTQLVWDQIKHLFKIRSGYIGCNHKFKIICNFLVLLINPTTPTQNTKFPIRCLKHVPYPKGHIFISKLKQPLYLKSLSAPLVVSSALWDISLSTLQSNCLLYLMTRNISAYSSCSWLFHHVSGLTKVQAFSCQKWKNFDGRKSSSLFLQKKIINWNWPEGLLYTNDQFNVKWGFPVCCPPENG